jgi:hypothetical protein
MTKAGEGWGDGIGGMGWWKANEGKVERIKRGAGWGGNSKATSILTFNAILPIIRLGYIPG